MCSNKMMQHYPQLNYVPDGPKPHPQAHLHWLFFDCMVDPDSRRYLSEDFAFCRRWRDMGGKVYVDLNSKLQHAGQHLYRGDLIESLEAAGPLVGFRGSLATVKTSVISAATFKGAARASPSDDWGGREGIRPRPGEARISNQVRGALPARRDGPGEAQAPRRGKPARGETHALSPAARAGARLAATCGPVDVMPIGIITEAA